LIVSLRLFPFAPGRFVADQLVPSYSPSPFPSSPLPSPSFPSLTPLIDLPMVPSLSLNRSCHFPLLSSETPKKPPPPWSSTTSPTWAPSSRSVDQKTTFPSPEPSSERLIFRESSLPTSRTRPTRSSSVVSRATSTTSRSSSFSRVSESSKRSTWSRRMEIPTSQR
jgi:hypothetical protein